MDACVINSDIFADIKEWLEQSGMFAALRFEQPDLWQEVWANLRVQPINYAASMIDYQRAYMRSSGRSIVDISMILLNDGKPCGIWPLTLTMGDSSQLSSQNLPVLPPVFITSVSAKTIKKITSSALRFVMNAQKALSQNVIESQEFIAPHALNFGLSEWHQQWLTMGAAVNVKHDLYVDLALSMDEIRANFRKSYRPLINVGIKTWASEIMDCTCPNVNIWAEFKALHLQVAGRITRSDETWGLQFQMILRGEAMLIYLRDNANQNRMVGAGFFQLTLDEGVYAVAAYDRELFDKPLGHVVQQRAIETMKKQGLRYYRIGERLFPSDKPTPTDKEINISLFKQGFAGYLLPRFMFSFANDGVVL